MEKYDLKSDKAAAFMNQNKIAELEAYAKKFCTQTALVEQILAKAREMKGIEPEEAAILFLNQNPKFEAQIFDLAQKIKEAYYGPRVVLFAPLYLSNYCINQCTYCPYHAQNKHILRKKMSQSEIKAEVMALQDMGHKRLALELGEDPVHNPLEYVLESIDTIYGIHHKRGSIRRVNVNIAATSVENYRRLNDAKIGTYILFQETYNKTEYERLHKKGPKADYAYHTEAMDRAMQAGIEDVGLGVLFGLNNCLFELIGLLLHARHLEETYGAGPHTISMPRLRPADGINLQDFANALPDALFLKLIAVIRIAVPYTGMIISTRESAEIRRQGLSLGISQISGGSKTSVGGYAKNDTKDIGGAQFEIEDTRSLDEIVCWLMRCGYIPSFCTSCYGNGRQGEDFMEICKKQQIHNFCAPNALLTLKEYLLNYATEETKAVGEELLAQELAKMPLNKRQVLKKRLQALKDGTIRFY